MNIVVVESPAKAKTINKYLGPDYKVMASYGHVRDLPAKDGSVLPDEDFAMLWDVDTKSRKRLNEIATAVKNADRLILATDPDREGEAISWHILEALKQKKALKNVAIERVVFNAITKSAILEAMKHPREIDTPLVDAYLARRALDYLVGFTLSPVLWRKLPGARSAGRVQSVALRLVCDREKEIETFVSREYWSIVAALTNADDQPFQARLVRLDGEKLDKFAISGETQAVAIKASVEQGAYKVTSVEIKPQKRHPFPPFTTSTLQQEASRKLGFSASHTMRTAQRLYEGINIDGETQGLITYMRTDGVQLAPEAVDACRDVINQEFGGKYLPDSPRIYKTKAKNAQEAHEAIRPTSLARLPKQVKGVLDADQARLYELIWKRTIASQMQSAELERTVVDITGPGGDGREIALRANGSVVAFDGFLTLYSEGKDDEEDEKSTRLPRINQGETPAMNSVEANQHFTEPPPRFTEATLIKQMEQLGIGRPSTYTSTLSVLREREYVRLDKKRLIPEGKGRLVTAFLENFFNRYVEYDFTADLEERLDKVSNGEIAWKELLREFWTSFAETVDGTKDLRITEVLDALNESLKDHVFPVPAEGGDPRACSKCEGGRLSLKVGRYGAFIGCSNYPECRFTRQLGLEGAAQDNAASGEDRVLGNDPDSGDEILLKSGRFGPYVERADENAKKPPRASIPKGMDLETVDLNQALQLLALPREIGLHPETGSMITAGLGRYGPFVLHDGKYANLPTWEEVFTVGINRAVTVLAEKKERGGRATSQTIKDLGEHPELGGKMQVLSGRYGPYVKHGKINATLPRDMKPEEVSVEQAVELIDAKAAKGGKTAKGGKKTPQKRAKKT